jgi:histidyl-tRNA synthetase
LENKLSKAELIQAPRGTKDVLPEEAVKWRVVEQAVHEVGRLFGYGEIRTPSFENLRLFKRAVGEETDIISKEMYLLQPRGDEKEEFALRPELTAPVVRAAIEHGMLTGQSDCVRLYYCSAPNFRYEKPQLGRFRQHHQFGTELLGPASPLADAETISFAISVFRKLGLSNFRVRLNSLGSKESREAWKSVLVPYLRDHISKLSKDSQRRTETNPLRVLDSKAPEDQEIIRNAPKIRDYLNEEERDYVNDVRTLVNHVLGSTVIAVEDPLLVRGIDYYSGIVFEVTSSDLGAQDALCGGGRYNYLVDQLGGPSTPAIGFGAGVERLLIALGDTLKPDTLLPEKEQFNITIYLVANTTAERNYASFAAYDLRVAGIRAVPDLSLRSIKAQMREANRMGARYTLFFKGDEIALKDMSSGEQEDFKVKTEGKTLQDEFQTIINRIKDKCRTDPNIHHSSFTIHHS